MEIVLFSKFFEELSMEELGEKALELGYDGIDIAVRPGHPIHAGNAVEALPGAVETWRSMGLSSPMATAPVSANDPAAGEVEPMYAACAAAGVPRLKIGFWPYRAGDDYWKVLDAARSDLDGFAKLGEKYGVQTCYQAHSGALIGSNCAGLMHLVRGSDPRYVGAYPDFGHMALDGEDYDLGVGMVREYLSIVGIKDAAYFPQPEGRTPRFVSRMVKVGKGSVDWHRALGALRRVEFDGPLTVHTEYDFDESIMRRVGYAETGPPNVEEYAREDAAYLRQVLAELGD